MEIRWIMCPVCNSKTRIQLRKNTIIQNLMLYCPKCKQERLINVKDFRVEVIE